MTRPAKCVIMTHMCILMNILRSKTKSVTVGFVCSDGGSTVMFNGELLGTRAMLYTLDTILAYTVPTLPTRQIQND